MGWEKRGDHYYYYRKKRVNGRVVSEYVGRGEEAEKIARQEEAKHRRREERRAAWNEYVEAVEAADDMLDHLGEQVQALTQGLLYAAGFHNRKGQWRRRRRLPYEALSEESGGAEANQDPESRDEA